MKSLNELIHHSDRGSQYCSTQYQQILHKNNITLSMTDGYDCCQNALAERINLIFERRVPDRKPSNIHQARETIAQAVKLYNYP